MKQISSLGELIPLSDAIRAQGGQVALIPTLGSIHPGKQALIKAAVAAGRKPIVSVFVNPLQFAASESVQRYPRVSDADVEACRQFGAEVAFVPPLVEMIPAGFSSTATEDHLSRTLCGPSRVGHFRGVTTMLAKLLNVTRAESVYFGAKTLQRAAVARKFIKDLGFQTAVEIAPTEREADGLAWATANSTFTASQRQDALALITALRTGKTMADSGVRSPDRIIAEVTHLLGQRRRIRTIYIAIVTPDTLEPAKEVIPGKHVLALAVWIDEVRLVDNIAL